MSSDFKEKVEVAASEYSLLLSAQKGFKAGASFAWDILVTSFDKERKRRDTQYLNIIKGLTYERQLLQELTKDYVDFFKVADCQSCDPTTGFTCPECAHWNRCNEALKTLGLRK